MVRVPAEEETKTFEEVGEPLKNYRAATQLSLHEREREREKTIRLPTNQPNRSE